MHDLCDRFGRLGFPGYGSGSVNEGTSSARAASGQQERTFRSSTAGDGYVDVGTMKSINGVVTLAAFPISH